MKVNKDGKIKVENMNDVRDFMKEVYEMIYTIQNDVQSIKNRIENQK